MMGWNPLHYVQHAWTKTKTLWGKLSLILFYSLIWITILTSLIQLVWPRIHDLRCFLDVVVKDNDKHAKDAAKMIVIMSRCINVVLIGVMAYADMGGLTVKNVATTTVLVSCYTAASYPSQAVAMAAGCVEDSNWSPLWWLVYPGWALVALICTILEDKLGEGGESAEEYRSLM
jgi:hypothetical protein